MEHVKAFFTAPVFADDEETTRIARLLSLVLWGSIIVAIVTLPPLFLIAEDPLVQATLHLFTVVVCLASIRLVRLGRVHQVATWLPITVSGLMLISIIYSPRPFNIGVAIGLVSVVFAGLVAQRRKLLYTVALNLGVAALGMGCWLVLRPYAFDVKTILADGIAFIWFSIIMGFAALLSSEQLRNTLQQVRHSKQIIADRNAALEREVAERRAAEQSLANRTRELTQVLEMSKRVAATLDLPHMLDLIIDCLKPVVDYSALTIWEITGTGHMQCLIHSGELPLPQREWHYDAALDLPLTTVIERQQPVVIENIWADDICATTYRAMHSRQGLSLSRETISVAYVPLVSRGHVIGLMALQHNTAHAYHRGSLPLVTAFASQIAVSMENARLHKQAIQAAALTERSRLARELHDSVSQALFGIVLGSRTLLSHSVQNTPSAPTAEYVLSLAEAALSEMRALIFELRPESLQSEGLVSAFRKQATALCSRHKIDVEVDILNQEPDLSIEAKEALYRIGLEAIQNTIKHANASRVALRLAEVSDAILLEIKDNGRGFDPHGNFPGHLGLHTMRERAEQLGGSLHLSSAIGQGTQVQVQLPTLRMIAPHVVDLKPTVRLEPVPAR